jgi:hypothetical protein
MTVQFVRPKDPDDIDDFTLEWAPRLNSGETISSATVSILSGGGAVDTTGISGGDVTARISGGSDGVPIVARWRVNLSSGRRLDETVTIPVVTR